MPLQRTGLWFPDRPPIRRLATRVAEEPLTEEKNLCVMGKAIYMMHKIKLPVPADSAEARRGRAVS